MGRMIYVQFVVDLSNKQKVTRLKYTYSGLLHSVFTVIGVGDGRWRLLHHKQSSIFHWCRFRRSRGVASSVCLLFYVLATSKIILGWIPPSDSVHLRPTGKRSC